MHVDHVGLRIEVIVPDVLQQHGAGHHLAGMLHQIFEQAELARLQGQFFLAADDAVGEPVEFEIADAVDGLFRRTALATRQHFDPREQFGEGIRLRQIVVAAGTQALDAVVDLAERGEDQRRRAVALLAQRADQRQAVALGQHAVHHQHVVIAAVGQREALLAVGGEIGDVPDFAKRLDEIVGGVAVVFDNQKAHAGIGTGTGG